jgi:hypothetical protein
LLQAAMLNSRLYARQLVANLAARDRAKHSGPSSPSPRRDKPA